MTRQKAAHLGRTLDAVTPILAGLVIVTFAVIAIVRQPQPETIGHWREQAARVPTLERALKEQSGEVERYYSAWQESYKEAEMWRQAFETGALPDVHDGKPALGKMEVVE